MTLPSCAIRNLLLFPVILPSAIMFLITCEGTMTLNEFLWVFYVLYHAVSSHLLTHDEWTGKVVSLKTLCCWLRTCGWSWETGFSSMPGIAQRSQQTSGHYNLLERVVTELRALDTWLNYVYIHLDTFINAIYISKRSPSTLVLSGIIQKILVNTETSIKHNKSSLRCYDETRHNNVLTLFDHLF